MMFTKEERSTFAYWFAHWCAFQMTALNCHQWKLKYLFHDFEKPWLKLFFDYKKVQKFHRTHNRHHLEWLENKLEEYDLELDFEPQIVKKYVNGFDYESAVIDWECSRFTKIEAPLTAYEEFNRLICVFQYKYPLISKYCSTEFMNNIIETIKKLGLYGNN